MLEHTASQKPSGIAVLLTFGVAVGGALSAAPVLAGVTIEGLGRYEQPDRAAALGEGAAEISAYDPGSHRLFVVNGFTNTVDILDISDPTAPSLVRQIDVTPYGDNPNSVATANGLVAVAVEASPATDPGTVAFFDIDGDFINSVQVGAVPDMVTFTALPARVLVANEGFASEDYTLDPEGTISIIDLTDGAAGLTQAHVATVDFTAFNDLPLDDSVRIFGPGATVAQDLEPEFITVLPFSPFAYVSLQDNNAIAKINFLSGQVVDIFGLGFRDYNTEGGGLDASNEDGEINIQPWPVFGMYQPDGIAAYRALAPRRGLRTFIITTNEGEERNNEVFGPTGVGNEPEEVRIADITLDPTAFPDAATLQLDENLGRLKVSIVEGDTDGDGDYDELYGFGARSFSIYDGDTGEQVFDSGDDFARIIAARIADGRLPERAFNANDDDNSEDTFDSRSDDQGVEPNDVALGHVGLHTIAFITLERVGGVMIYDVTDPYDPRFCDYVNDRDFEFDAEDPQAGDLRPEGILFIPRSQSPTHQPLLVVSHETSGTVTIYKVLLRPGACGEGEVAALGD